jgi:benzoyl-CoA reductase/2-hydroxyglutaryl-CoA dehydratase subunit BcrC/BadD/HgdB
MNPFFENVEPMTGEEIAQEFGTTRQYVCNTLKSGLRKLYNGLSKMNPDMTPFEIVNAIREFFGICDTDEIQMFFNAFPPDIRQKVELSMKR